LTAGAPPPRGLPYLGLESTSGTGSPLLDEHSPPGTFRTYAPVLHLAGGLGAPGRLLAGRRGCTAVVTAAHPAVAAAGAVLTRRARLRSQVHHVCAGSSALPFRDGRFTHAWIVESLPELPDVPAALGEGLRVVRRGGDLG